eukprot:jgi/Botrbrau1/19631/Bobra.0003s0001.1
MHACQFVCPVSNRQTEIFWAWRILHGGGTEGVRRCPPTCALLSRHGHIQVKDWLATD